MSSLCRLGRDSIPLVFRFEQIGVGGLYSIPDTKIEKGKQLVAGVLLDLIAELDQQRKRLLQAHSRHLSDLGLATRSLECPGSGVARSRSEMGVRTRIDRGIR